MKMIFWLGLCGLLFACSGKKTTAEGGALNPDRIPDKLQKEKPVGQKLTSTQMDRLRTLLQKTPLLPDSALFLPRQDETVTEKTIREVKIANLPMAAKQHFQMIVTNCTPDNKKTGSGEFTKGKSQAWNYAENMAGRNCPVEVKRERHQAINWVQVETIAGQPRATGTTEAAHRTFFTITSGELAKNSTITKINARSASRGAIKIENGKTTNYRLTQGAHTIVVLGEGPINSTSQSQLLETTESNRFTREEIVALKIAVKGLEFQLYYYIKHVDGAVNEESMYINGEPVVADDFADFLKGTF